MVMSSDMYKQHINKIIETLAIFEKTPKNIEGRQITQWFKIGENLFTEFYDFGINIKWDYSTIKKQSGLSDVVIKVTRNQEWLQTFINIYPNLRIDLDLIGSASKICKVRSGIEVLLRGFVNVDTNFDKVLTDLEQFGELEEFDRCLKVWINTGHRPDFDSDYSQSIFPTAHWWWN